MFDFVRRMMGKRIIPPGYVKGFNVMDEYVRTPPSNQLAVDLFKGEWSCRFPESFGVQVSGAVPAFEDPRVKWALEQMGGVQGQRVLELGPLEGGHMYMLEQAGASHVLSVEANKRAYMKCLIAKEITGVTKGRFLLGDFNEYMKGTAERFDACFACGILYHMLNPAETIELISRVADKVFIWSHYFDAALIDANPPIKQTMGNVEKVTHKGFSHELYEHFYLEFLSVPAFCGGSNPKSYWMSREGMLGCLKFFGFKDIAIGFDQPNHPGGPAFCVVAKK